jgi:hypothetical protein
MAGLLASEVLAKAADLIEPEGAWTQFISAAETPLLSEDEAPTDEEGDPIEPDESAPEMRCWCATGAIWKAADLGWAAQPSDPRATAADYVRQIVGDHVPHWNDAPGRTQAEVVAALRQAAELARSEGQ